MVFRDMVKACAVLAGIGAFYYAMPLGLHHLVSTPVEHNSQTYWIRKDDSYIKENKGTLTKIYWDRDGHLDQVTERRVCSLRMMGWISQTREPTEEEVKLYNALQSRD